MREETPYECSEGGHGSCPFNFFTEESNQAQNYGCLPQPLDIVNMRVVHGKTWECHSSDNKACLGAINYLKEHNLPHTILDKKLLNLKDDWGQYLRKR